MKRRRAIAILATTVSAAGCLGSVPRQSERTPAGEFSHQFRTEPLSNYGASEIEQPPTIEFRPDEDELTIRGKLAYGNPTCMGVGVESLEYAQDTLSATVTAVDTTTTKTVCDGSLEHKQYWLTVTFPNRYPDTVEATEVNVANERRSATAHR